MDKLKQQGKASIIVALNGEVIGLIGLSDVIREDSKSMIQNLHDLDTETILLTGDNTETADYFASQVGINEVYGNLLPEDKLLWIEKLKNDGKKVCMIGDGVNDAPALKTADVSVAMGSIGSDVAIETADVVLMKDEPSKVPQAIKKAKKVHKIVLQNIIGSIGIKLVTLALIGFGFSGMWLAVFADVGVNLIAVLNSLRAMLK